MEQTILSTHNLVKTQTVDDLTAASEPLVWMTLGERIKAARARHGWGSTVLDKKAGLSQGIVSRYESGERGVGRGGASAETLRKIAIATGVRLEWLVTGEGRMLEEGEEVDTRLPQRAIAAEQARKEGVWPEAIRSRLADPLTEREPRMSAAWWLLQIKVREEEMLEEARRRLEERDPPPTPRPAKKEPPPKSAPASHARPAEPTVEKTQEVPRIERVGPSKKKS